MSSFTTTKRYVSLSFHHRKPPHPRKDVNVFYPEPVHFAGEIVVNEDGDSSGLRFLLPLFLAEQLHGILYMEVSRIQNHSLCLAV